MFNRPPRWAQHLERKITSALADLQAAVTKLGTDISAEIQSATDALKASQAANDGSVSQADAEAIVARLNDLDATVTKATAAMTPAPPAAEPAPAPTTPAA